MNTNDPGRKEPSLADLEAFEKLLRESISGQEAAPATAESRSAGPDVTAPAAPPAGDSHDAMAELTRLIEAPLDFSLPPPAAPAAAQTPATQPAPVTTHAHIDTAFEAGWPTPPHVETHFAPAAPPQAAAPATAPSATALDPLAAFEEELRRFDATRLATAAQTPDPGVPDVPVAPPEFVTTPDVELSQEELLNVLERQRSEAAPFDSYAPQAASPPPLNVPEALSPLEAAEQRLAAEAAAASYEGPDEPLSDVQRSKGVFMALGGLAVAGLVVVGGSFMFSGSKKATSGGDVPVIAAKTAPTKEKPADPGGVDIPNQNAQIMAGKNLTQETKPAQQVVNTTEQPMDLKEVTRRESVRVIAPSPYQQGNPTPTAQEAQAGIKPADVEQRRVTSISVPVATEAKPAVPAAPPRVVAPAKPETAKSEPVKSEQRPLPKKVEPPKPAPTPKVANTPATPQVKATAKSKAAATTSAKSKKSASGPLSLTNNSKATAASSGGSGYAVQLASRPTEENARSASSTLGGKYRAQLGGRAARVVSGEANGKTVYRVRASGFSREGAVEACNKIKAAGGACFITRG